MRSVSAALNRVLLAFFGLLIVCASAWFLTSGLDAGHHLPGISVYLAATHDQIGAILSPRTHWLVPCGVLASALAFVAGLFLLLMQVPRRPANSPLRLSGSDGALLATLSPDVLSQALSERVQDLPGVERCTVFVTGSPSKLWVQADTSVSGNASQAARRSRPPGALGEFDVSIEGRHRPAVAGNHRNGNRRMRRGAGRASPCPTFVVGRAPPFTRPGLSLSSRFAQSADHFAPMRRFSRLFTEVA